MQRFGTGSAIVGIGETKLGRRPGTTPLELQAEAVVAAVKDAGLAPADVDGLFNLGPYSNPSQMFALTLGEYLGMHPSVESSIDAAGTFTVMHMIANAVWAIESGHCNVAVCTFGEAAATGRVMSGHGWTSTQDQVETEAPFGIVGAVVPYALLASHHMAQYGTTEDGLGAVAVSARRHAMLNENAVMRKPMTLEDHHTSRMIATPLRLFDCSSMVDGAGAMVLTTEERARDLPHPQVSVLGLAAHMSHSNSSQISSFEELRIREVADRALGEAAISLSDVDVAEIHDAFTISTLLYLEEIGFCGRGEGSAYALEGNLDLGSRCPVNTHGGLLSQGHVAGFLHVTEAVKQLRGQAGAAQVADAEVAMVAGGGGIFGMNAVMLLGAGR